MAIPAATMTNAEHQFFSISKSPSHCALRAVMMVHMEKELEIAKNLAREAGAILLNYYQRALSIDWKAPGDPVTVADREANEYIVSHIKREFPDDGILSEEDADDLARLERPRVWMIDPMDGTREFIDHRPDFAVQIGLIAGGTPVAGAVYQPATDKLYYAAKGIGAFLESGGAAATA